MKAKIKYTLSVLAFIISIVAGAQDVQPMLDQPAPLFSLTDLKGKQYSLEELKGKFTVIHIAATWCPFCNAEAPYLQKLYNDYHDRGVEVFIIDVMEEGELVERSYSRFNFSFPVLLDLDGKVSASYAPEGVQPALARHEVPIASNLIIDKEGKIRFYSLLNTTSFDAELRTVREKLDELVNGD